FRAEDGIRVFHVTGVQTCALPICDRPERQGGLPGPLASAACRGAGRGRRSAAARRDRRRSVRTNRDGDRERVLGRHPGRFLQRRDRRARSPAHDARRDLRRDRHGESQGAGRMNGSIVRQLIAKDLVVMRPMMIGALVVGGVGIALMPFGETRFFVGWLILFIAITLLGVFTTAVGVLTERKDRVHLFVLTLPVSPAQYLRAKLTASAVAFFV